jgi:hypothetical protein
LVERERSWVEGCNVSKRRVWDAHDWGFEVLVEEHVMRDRRERREAMVAEAALHRQLVLGNMPVTICLVWDFIKRVVILLGMRQSVLFFAHQF